MSRKHNCKHPRRGLSNYPERLARRGLHKTPIMESLASMRQRQGKAVLPESFVYANWDLLDAAAEDAKL